MEAYSFPDIFCLPLDGTMILESDGPGGIAVRPNPSFGVVPSSGWEAESEVESLILQARSSIAPSERANGQSAVAWGSVIWGVQPGGAAPRHERREIRPR
jgi:hypothetical protein